MLRFQDLKPSHYQLGDGWSINVPIYLRVHPDDTWTIECGEAKLLTDGKWKYIKYLTPQERFASADAALDVWNSLPKELQRNPNP